MNASERVLGENGFEPFPERLREMALKQEYIKQKPDEGDTTASDLTDHGKGGKAELAKKSSEHKKLQEAADKKAKDNEAKKIEMLSRVAAI